MILIDLLIVELYRQHKLVGMGDIELSSKQLSKLLPQLKLMERSYKLLSVGYNK